MEEERRLMYVGVTRAEQQLFITNAQMRTLYGRTNMNPASRFIKEIPVELLEGMDAVKPKSRMASRASGSTLQQPKTAFYFKRTKLCDQQLKRLAVEGEGLEGWR